MFGRKRYRNLHESARRERRRRRRGTSRKSKDGKSKGFSLSRSDTGIRRYAQQHPETFHAAGPPEPSVRSSLELRRDDPRTPPPRNNIPRFQCAEKLRPDETKIPKTTTNPLKFIRSCILQIEIFYLVLSRCFPLMEKRPDHYRPKPNRMGTSTIVYTIFARRMRHVSTRRSEGIIPPPSVFRS